MFVQTKLCFKFVPSKGKLRFCLSRLAHGVIGNTPVFGTVIQGSSPCGPTYSFKENPDVILISGFLLFCVVWARSIYSEPVLSESLK